MSPASLHEVLCLTRMPLLRLLCRQAVMELPPEQKQARLMQLNLLANVRPGCTTSQYPGRRPAVQRLFVKGQQFLIGGAGLGLAEFCLQGAAGKGELGVLCAQ